MKLEDFFGRAIFFILFGLVSFQSSAQQQDALSSKPDHFLVLTVLFPETADWKRVADVPVMRRAELERIENRLRDAFMRSPLYRPTNEPGCSFIDGIFDPSSAYEGQFHHIDLNADGHDDIIYVGSSICEGGDSATVIWFAEGNGFRVPQRYLWKFEVLRIGRGNPAGVASVEVGCCASPYDVYSMGTISSPTYGRKYKNEMNSSGTLTMAKGTVLPSSMIGPLEFRGTGAEFALRSSPEVKDEYDEMASGAAYYAVFGNILSKYLAGCSGTVVGSNGRDGQNLWYFVVLDRFDNGQRFRTHTPFEVNAGWVKAAEIELLK